MMMILNRSEDIKLKQKIIISLKNISPLLDNNTLNGEMINNIIELVKKDNSYEICYQVINLFESLQNGIQLESISEKVIPTLIYILKKGKISKKLQKKINEIINNLIKQIGELREKEIEKQEDLEIENEDKKINLKTNEEINSNEGEEFLNIFFNDSKKEINTNNKKENIKENDERKIEKNKNENNFNLNELIDKPKKFIIKELKTVKLDDQKNKEKKKKNWLG